MNNLEFEQQYSDTLHQFGKEVFKEFLGELSRKRQISLLVSSAITILLTFAIVEPVESVFAGIKFKFSDVNIIPTIAAIFCLYFLVTYLISALQDWQMEKYRTMPVRMASGKVFEQFVSIFNQQSQVLETQLDEAKKRQTILKKAGEEMENKKDEINEKMAILQKRHDAAMLRMIKKGASPDKLELLKKQQLVKQWETMFSIIDVPEFMDVLIHYNVQEDNKDKDKKTDYDAMGKKEHAFEKAVYWYLFFRNMNVLLEIIFPSALAFFAIGSVIWKTAQ